MLTFRLVESNLYTYSSKAMQTGRLRAQAYSNSHAHALMTRWWLACGIDPGTRTKARLKTVAARGGHCRETNYREGPAVRSGMQPPQECSPLRNAAPSGLVLADSFL